MEHAGEVWQELDFNGEPCGGIVPAELDVEKVKLFHGVAAMLYRFQNGEVEYLFQHRSKRLRENADTWDVSAGGHVNLDERQIEAAVRETCEEIGVNLDKNNLKTMYIIEDEIDLYNNDKSALTAKQYQKIVSANKRLKELFE